LGGGSNNDAKGNDDMMLLKPVRRDKGKGKVEEKQLTTERM
jgi:hypothetical protein